LREKQSRIVHNPYRFAKAAEPMNSLFDPIRMLWPGRKIHGASAVLLPFDSAARIDWPAFSAHLLRTADFGLMPAVNMDTGYVHLLDDSQRRSVLRQAQETLGKTTFFAGAFVGDRLGDAFAPDTYARQCEIIADYGGIPVIFQSFGLTALGNSELIDAYTNFGCHCDQFIAFELGTMFAPFGKIYSLDVYECLIAIKQCLGVKHSSLDRELEWQRLQLKNRIRPEFRVYTGNDLAIDMVMYGSDYLLGLSTMAPDLFALRDRFWENGDPAFYELNDVLQYLGFVAFRDPVPAYKHSAAMFLKMRGWIDSDATHPGSPIRPHSDREIFRDIGRKLGIPMEG
jgi:dihydrodipicolinate synthase/N-acetylneuraminate lyase